MKSETKISKTEFVLSMSPDAKPKEIVAAAKDAGLKLSEGYVYTIRSNAKRAGKKKNGHATETPVNAMVFVDADHAPPSVESQFTSLVLNIGLVRAKELMLKVQSQVSSLAA